jgi:hypothetical protein
MSDAGVLQAAELFASSWLALPSRGINNVYSWMTECMNRAWQCALCVRAAACTWRSPPTRSLSMSPTSQRLPVSRGHPWCSLAGSQVHLPASLRLKKVCNCPRKYRQGGAGMPPCSVADTDGATQFLRARGHSVIDRPGKRGACAKAIGTHAY